jgi:hypothetical protein
MVSVSQSKTGVAVTPVECGGMTGLRLTRTSLGIAASRVCHDSLMVLRRRPFSSGRLRGLAWPGQQYCINPR